MANLKQMMKEIIQMNKTPLKIPAGGGRPDGCLQA